MTRLALAALAAVFAAAGFDAAAVAAPPLPPGTPAFASLTGDAAAGKAGFVVCRTCHAVAAGQNRVGPSLHGVVGRAAGTVPGFTYSAANKNSHIVWTDAALYEFLLAPQAYVPGTKMTYAGVASAQKRADIVAYLKTNPAS